MDLKQIEHIKKTYEGVSSLRDDFFLFRAQTKVQLLTGQLQFFQSLAAITLAFVAIGVATKSFDLDIWFISSGVFSILLILYTFTHVREVIDKQDKGLRDTEELLQKEVAEVETKMFEAIRQNDPNIFDIFVKQKAENPIDINEKLSYAGEISTFLFCCSLLFCVVAIVNSYGGLAQIAEPYMFTIVICIAVLLSFKDWNIRLTERISLLLQSKVW